MQKKELTCPPFDIVHDYPEYQNIVVMWTENEQRFAKVIFYSQLSSLNPDTMLEEIKSFIP